MDKLKENKLAHRGLEIRGGTYHPKQPSQSDQDTRIFDLFMDSRTASREAGFKDRLGNEWHNAGLKINIESRISCRLGRKRKQSPVLYSLQLEEEIASRRSQ